MPPPQPAPGGDGASTVAAPLADLDRLSPRLRRLRHYAVSKVLFVKINKTAGTSVSKAFGLPPYDHLTAVQLRRRAGAERWASAYTFAVVRNPWDRVLSQYMFRRGRDEVGGLGFVDWVAATLRDHRGDVYVDSPLFWAQIDWLVDEDGRIIVDRVCRFERLQEGIDAVCDSAGIDRVTLPHLLATDHRHYTEYYDDATRRIVEEHSRRDIERFGYRFGT